MKGGSTRGLRGPIRHSCSETVVRAWAQAIAKKRMSVSLADDADDADDADENIAAFVSVNGS
jgi:hypothetical protein